MKHFLSYLLLSNFSLVGLACSPNHFKFEGVAVSQLDSKVKTGDPVIDIAAGPTILIPPAETPANPELGQRTPLDSSSAEVRCKSKFPVHETDADLNYALLNRLGGNFFIKVTSQLLQILNVGGANLLISGRDNKDEVLDLKDRPSIARIENVGGNLLLCHVDVSVITNFRGNIVAFDSNIGRINGGHLNGTIDQGSVGSIVDSALNLAVDGAVGEVSGRGIMIIKNNTLNTEHTHFDGIFGSSMKSPQ